MGFHIGVSSFQTKDNYACHRFIDKLFFNFVNSYEQFGERSVVIQTGLYFGLDMLPLTRYFYTDCDFDEAHVKDYLQSPESLIKLLSSLKEAILKEKDFSGKLNYQHFSHLDEELEEIIEESLNKQYPDTSGEIEEHIYKRQQLRTNPDPWAPYFRDGEILEHLDALLFRLNCYKSKGITEVFLTAG